MIGAIFAKKQAKQKFEARNRGDIDAFLEGWAKDVTYIFPGQSELSGTFNGLDQVRSWFPQFRQQFSEIYFELHEVFVSNIWALGATNKIAVHWTAHLRDHNGNLNEGPGVTVVHIRDGKTTFVQDFIFDLSPDFFQVKQSA